MRSIPKGFQDAATKEDSQALRTVILESSKPAPLPKILTSSRPMHSTQEKLQILDEILKSKNDNDPRLDSVFRNLSPEDKTELRKKYHSLPLEDRNGRGTLVFLIGREKKDSVDETFLKSVLAEAPCLSLNNCEIAASEKSMSPADLTTLAYPQKVAARFWGP